VEKHSNGNTIYKSTAIFTQTKSHTSAILAARLSIREYASQSTFHAENMKNNKENLAAQPQEIRQCWNNIRVK